MSITIATAVGAVTLKESWSDFEKGIDYTQGPWVNKEYLLEDWTKSDAVVNALMGSVAATTIGGTITRLFPHFCPESPNLTCIDARVKPQAEIDVRDSGRPRFNQAVIAARYAFPPSYVAQPTGEVLNSFPQNDSSGNDTNTPFTYAIQQIDFDTETIKLPGSAYKFATAPQLAVDVPVAITIGVAQIVITRKMVPYLPYALILSKLNGLNAQTFLGQPKGQIKFLKGRTKLERSSDGTAAQELEYVFKYREFDHNKFHRPDERSFDLVVDSFGANPYVYRDLTPLLA